MDGAGSAPYAQKRGQKQRQSEMQGSVDSRLCRKQAMANCRNDRRSSPARRGSDASHDKGSLCFALIMGHPSVLWVALWLEAADEEFSFVDHLGREVIVEEEEEL